MKINLTPLIPLLLGFGTVLAQVRAPPTPPSTTVFHEDIYTPDPEPGNILSGWSMTNSGDSRRFFITKTEGSLHLWFTETRETIASASPTHTLTVNDNSQATEPTTPAPPVVITTQVPAGLLPSIVPDNSVKAPSGGTIVWENSLPMHPPADPGSTPLDGSGLRDDSTIEAYRAPSIAEVGDRPPSRVRIGLHTWTLVVINPRYMPKADGITYCGVHLILLASDQDYQDIRDSVVHEIQHAMTCDDGGHAKSYNSTTEAKHEGIYYLSPRLVYVLENNPALTEWLAKEAIEDQHRQKHYSQDEMEPPALDIEGEPPPEYKP